MSFISSSRLRVLQAAVAALLCQSGVFAEYPDSPETPRVVEYNVDPVWLQRPERVGVLGAVSGIAVDRDDNVWVHNRGESPVHEYTASGEYVRTWGQRSIKEPHHLRVDPQGNIWVTDIGLHVVLQFKPDGTLLKTIGVSGETGEDDRQFNKPTDVAVTESGDAFVSDGYGNRRIVHYDKDGKCVKTCGQSGSQPGEFVTPHSIVFGADSCPEMCSDGGFGIGSLMAQVSLRAATRGPRCPRSKCKSSRAAWATFSGWA